MQSFRRSCQTEQALIEVTGSTLVIPAVSGFRVVVTSLLLSADAAVLIEFWEGDAGTPETTRKTGQMKMESGVPWPHSVPLHDAFIRTAPGLGVTIKPLAAVVVSGSISYYYEKP